VNAEPVSPEVSTEADARLDAVILACAEPEWCKVAILIARTTDAARAQAIDAPAQAIAARIYALTADRRLDVQGNVRRWRASDVRRPAI
jgi:Protein of unknown function